MHPTHHTTGVRKHKHLPLLSGSAAGIAWLCMGLTGCGDARADAASDAGHLDKPGSSETRPQAGLVVGPLLPQFPEDLLPTRATFSDTIKIVHLRQLIARRLDGCVIDRDWPAVASVKPSACGRGWDIAVEYQSQLEYGTEWIVPIQAAADTGPTLTWFTSSQEEAEAWLAHQPWAPVRLRSRILRTWVDPEACWGHPGVQIVLDMSAAARPEPVTARAPSDQQLPHDTETLASLQDQFPYTENVDGPPKKRWNEAASSCVGKEFSSPATVTAVDIERRDGYWVATLEIPYALVHGWHSNLFEAGRETGALAVDDIPHSWQSTISRELPSMGQVSVSLDGTGRRPNNLVSGESPEGLLEVRVSDPWLAWILSTGVQTKVSMRFRVTEASSKETDAGIGPGPRLDIVLNVEDVHAWQ